MGDHVQGEMNIDQHKDTFSFFIGLAKWGSLTIAVAVLFLTLMFAVEAGLFGSLAAAVILSVAGFFVLRDTDEE